MSARRILTSGRGLLALLVLALAVCAAWAWPLLGRSTLAMIGVANAQGRAEGARQRVEPALRELLGAVDADWGAAAFVRIFKQESELELHVRAGTGWRHLKTWPICTWSGSLGPKLREGDSQSPEGVYSVAARSLNPASSYHLSFNLGYPNAYDRAHGRTGSYLMVHGNCVSIGCYAMGDAAIEEIYTLVAAAIDGGQASVPVHVFPFRFASDTDPRLDHEQWGPFWRDLKRVHDAFEQTGSPPQVAIVDRRYTLVESEGAVQSR